MVESGTEFLHRNWTVYEPNRLGEFMANMNQVVQQLPSSQIAERAITAKHNIGKMRLLPMKLQAIENLKSEKVHIFNVGPWPQPVNTGSTGSFLIPGCPTEKPYVELLVLNANTGEWEPPISIIMEEYVIKSEDEMASL